MITSQLVPFSNREKYSSLSCITSAPVDTAKSLIQFKNMVRLHRSTFINTSIALFNIHTHMLSAIYLFPMVSGLCPSHAEGSYDRTSTLTSIPTHVFLPSVHLNDCARSPSLSILSIVSFPRLLFPFSTPFLSLSFSFPLYIFPFFSVFPYSTFSLPFPHPYPLALSMSVKGFEVIHG